MITTTPDRYPHFIVHRACWEIFAADLDRGPYALTTGMGLYLVREYRSPKGRPWPEVYETARTALEALDAIGPTAPSRAVILHTERVCRLRRGASRDRIVAEVLLDLYHPGRGHRALTEAQYAYATGRTVVEVRAALERLDASARADRDARAHEDAAHRIVCRSLHCRRCCGAIAFAR